jgi:hypothetical protein
VKRQMPRNEKNHDGWPDKKGAHSERCRPPVSPRFSMLGREGYPMIWAGSS